MVTNNLLFRLKERTTSEIEKAKNALLSMDGKIPVLLRIQVQVDMRGPDKSSYDIMLITQYNSLEDLDTYLKHPVHVEVAKYIQEAMDTGASLCYET
ncbi:hypothetical protein FACS189493_4910 [Spirochaetia bacterium]|nr:hypothetical protein FACS189493_4910 [Spirochaetia bacterium]